MEEAAEKHAKLQLGYSSNSDDDSDIEVDQKLLADDQDKRGRKEKRQGKEKKEKDVKMLGKRNKPDSDEEMASENEGDIELALRGSLGKKKRNLTPVQRKISVQKMLRDRSASRREGTQPQRLNYKLVPEEQVRLAKKINATWKHKIEHNEADRVVTCKKPKHLFAGKMSNGSANKR